MICNYVYEHVEDNTSHTVRYTNVFPRTDCSVDACRPLPARPQNLLMHFGDALAHRCCGTAAWCCPSTPSMWTTSLSTSAPALCQEHVLYGSGPVPLPIGRADQSVNESVMVKRGSAAAVTRHMIDCQDLMPSRARRSCAAICCTTSMMMAISGDLPSAGRQCRRAKQKEKRTVGLLQGTHQCRGLPLHPQFGGVTNLKIPKGDKLQSALPPWYRRFLNSINSRCFSSCGRYTFNVS